SDGNRSQHRVKRDPQRNSRAVKDSRPYVAPEGICSQQKTIARRMRLAHGADAVGQNLFWSIIRKPGGKGSRRQKQKDNREPDLRQPVPHQALPERALRARRNGTWQGTRLGG